jgi:HD-like signal output (HDOD) protein
LVIASGIVSVMPKLENFDIKQFWANSFNTATYSKWLAAETKTAPDLAFTGGLISGLGNILIRLGASEAALEVDRQLDQGLSRPAVERKLLGYTSEEVCAELCKRWKFSPELIATIAYSGDPLQAPETCKPACVVHLARYISEAHAANLSDEEVLQAFPFDVAEKLGLKTQFIIEKLPEIMALKSGMDNLVD